MGKGDIKKQKMYMALLMNANKHPFIKQGTRLFMIPVEAEEKERDQMMEDQVSHWLKYVCERLGAFESGVKMIQSWLHNFTARDISRKPWVEAAANRAGFKYLEKIKGKQKKSIIKVAMESLLKNPFGG